MDILLTNDDGYRAPGIRAAYEALSGLGAVHVVAPRDERSACSHAITLRRSIAVEKIEHEPFGTVFAVDGTPADCVRLATAVLIDPPITLVVAGINDGANAGVDTFYSGTVAGAREAAILGIPAMAFSHARRAVLAIDWNKARDATAFLVSQLLEENLPGPGFWSVNFPIPIPDPPADHIHRVPVATHPMPMVFDRTDGGDGPGMEFGYGASYWLREVTGLSDYGVIRDGGIAITAIPLIGRF